MADARPKFRSAFSKRRRVAVSFSKPSRTKQAFQAECDINNVMARFEKGGLLDHVNRFRGVYGDFFDAEDYHTACNKVIAANEAFMALPAKVRQRFQNDPQQLLFFLEDPANRAEAEQLGLLKPGSSVPPDDGQAPSAPAGVPDKSPQEPE